MCFTPPDQTLRDHFHLHCLIPAGALSFDLDRWILARKNFLFPVKGLRLVFRGKFLDMLRHAFERDQLRFPGRTARLAAGTTFSAWLAPLASKSWVVYAKRPLSSPGRILDYLGRYTHRVALSNNRILSVQASPEGGRVTFSYRDRKHGNQLKSMTLGVDQFIGRFLLHVLPDGSTRIRHFRLLANRSKRQNLARCRQLLGLVPQPPQRPKKSTRDLMLQVAGVDLTLCPACRAGTMMVIGPLPSLPLAACRAQTSPTPLLDSS